MLRIIVILSLSILISCTKYQPTSNSTSFTNVNQRLWPHFSQFEYQASLQGIDVDLESAGITGEIESIDPDGVAGTCQYGQHIHHVTVDEEFWNAASQLLREYVVFHELGHCYLDRGHDDTHDSQGNCLSIMQSGLSGCRNNYSSPTRSRLIDELFHGE